MKNFFNEFKAFISRGNVIDLAIGVILGGAFGKIVASLVNDILMPIIGYAIGDMDFSDMRFVLKQATENNPETSINYGLFIQNIVYFLIIAFSIFMVVKFINKIKEAAVKKEEEEKIVTPPAPTKEQSLLQDILDELKKSNKKDE